MNPLLIRRRGMMVARQGGLPYDAEVEYLESNGNQYIQLPYGFDKTDKIIIVAALIESGTNKFLATSRTWDSNSKFTICGVAYTYFSVGYGSALTANTQLLPKTVFDNNFHTWEYDNYNFSIVDLGLVKDVSSISFGTPTTEIKLFYGYNSNTTGKITSFQQWKDGSPVLDMVAVRVNNVGYMYDRVSGQLFGNQGTGNFVLGPDIQ